MKLHGAVRLRCNARVRDIAGHKQVGVRPLVRPVPHDLVVLIQSHAIPWANRRANGAPVVVMSILSPALTPSRYRILSTSRMMTRAPASHGGSSSSGELMMPPGEPLCTFGTP